jgi:hypothetical protein
MGWRCVTAVFQRHIRAERAAVRVLATPHGPRYKTVTDADRTDVVPMLKVHFTDHRQDIGRGSARRDRAERTTRLGQRPGVALRVCPRQTALLLVQCAFTVQTQVRGGMVLARVRPSLRPSTVRILQRHGPIGVLDTY